MPARYFLQHNWPAITISVTAVAIGCAAIVMLRNMPPHRIVMATGPEGDAYYEVGERYRAALARENVEVQLVPTAGSVENLTKLLDPRSGASVGLIEGGLTPAGDSSALESLAQCSTSRCGGSTNARSRAKGSMLCAAAKYQSGLKAAGRGRFRSS